MFLLQNLKMFSIKCWYFFKINENCIITKETIKPNTEKKKVKQPLNIFVMEKVSVW